MSFKNKIDAAPDSTIINPGSHGHQRTNRSSQQNLNKLIANIEIGKNDPQNTSKEGSINKIMNSTGIRRSGSSSQKRVQAPNQPKKSRKNHKKHQKYQQNVPLKALNSSEHTNVTCRFVVHADVPFSPTSLSVDKPIPAKQIWRIISPIQECPICLERPEVPRMLGCGHLMCFHCMLKHRKFSETPDVCPICGEVVSLTPSRAIPVSFLESDSSLLPKEGEEVVLTLMSRHVDSTVALPVNLELAPYQQESGFPSPDYIFWTRVCQGDLEYAKSEMAQELKYLITASKKCANDFGFDCEGYNDAVTDLKRHIHNLNVNADHNMPSKQTDNSQSESSTASKDNNHQSNNDMIFFYQTSFESSVVYTLSALDVSILKMAYGTFENFPTSLITKIQSIEFVTLDRTNDKRMKFLSHIPEQTPVAFLECCWEGIIDQKILLKFKSKLDERTEKKNKKVEIDYLERQQAIDAIDAQFKHEIAEAILPHDNMWDVPSGIVSIDTSQLPKLKKTSSSADEKQYTAAQERQWVQQQNDYENLMKNAYVPKRGRKNIIIPL